jgi:CheY-like chemotaxis protein/rhodanese-related sulfurtransferase
VLRDAVALAQARRGHDRVLVDVRQAPELAGWRLGDAQRLVQVLAALLTNALAFTPVGRVAVQVQRGRDDDRLLFSVSDTGIGIAPSQLMRLFELRAEQTTATVLRQGGGALALAAARQRVRQLGGDIEAASVPGAGSRFSFELPLPACDAPAASPPAELALDGRHLLLAEDDELAAEVLAAQLESLGLGVEKAGNGQLAAALAVRLPFDWLLVDRQLAGLEGLAVVRRLREHEQANAVPRTPALLLVADETEALRRDALQAGVDDLLVKPVSQAQLRAVLLRTATAQRAATRPRSSAPMSAATPAPEPSGSEAHALGFLGQWSARWAQADAEQRRALRADLRSCAQRLDDSALAAAADSGDAAALDAAVDAALMRLRGLAP